MSSSMSYLVSQLKKEKEKAIGKFKYQWFWLRMILTVF
jgi:hypothetical protein